MINIETGIDEINIEIESSTKKATSGINDLISTIDKLKTSLSNITGISNKASEAISKIGESTKSISSKNIDNAVNSFDKLQNTVNNIKGEFSELKKEFDLLIKKLEKKYSLDIQVKNTKKDLKDGEEEANSFKDKLKNFKMPKEVENAVKSIKDTFKSIATIIGTVIADIKVLGSAISSAFSKILSFYKVWLKIVSVPFKPIVGIFKSLGSHLTSGLGKLRKWMGALFGIRSMYNAIRMAARAWLDSQDAAAKQVTADFAYMKYALGSAVAPVMQYLVNLAYQLLSLFARIIYYISGINIFAKASAGSYSKMAGAAGSTAKSAKETAKALQGFDELNNIDLEKASGGGGGGGGGGMPSMDLADLSSSTIFDDLLEKIKAGDWYGLGLEIGRKLNKAMDAIPWNEIQDKVRKGATAVGKILNGLIDSEVIIHIGEMLTRLTETVLIGIDTFLTTSMTHFQKLGTQLGQVFNRFTDLLPLAGETLGKYFQAILEIIDGFVIAFDWKRVGDNFAKGINNMFAELDAGTAADIVSQGLIKLFNTITETIENIDWEEIGRKVTEFIVNIDWTGIGEAISKAVSALLEIDLNIDWSGVNSETVAKIGRAFSSVTNTLQNFLKKLLEIAGSDKFQEWVQKTADKITTISEKVNEIDWTPFVEALQKVADLVFDGIDLFVTALKWIGDHPDTAETIVKIATAIAAVTIAIKLVSAAVTLFTLATNPVTLIILGIIIIVTTFILKLQELKEKFENFKEIWIAGWEYLKEKIPETIENLKTAISEKWEAIKQNVSDIVENIKNTVSEKWEALKTNISEKVENIKNILKEKWDNIKKNVTDTVENIKSAAIEKWENIKTKITDVVENIKNNVKDKFENMKNNVKNIFEDIKNAVSNAWDGIWNKVRSVGNSILGGIEKLVNGVIEGVNRMIDALNGMKFKAPDWLPLIGGKEFNLTISKIGTVSLPRLAKGGVLYDDTIVRVGEYSNANSNPEIVAPQSIIRSTVLDAFKEILRSDELKKLANKEVSLDLGIVVDLDDTTDFTNAITKGYQGNEYDTAEMSKTIGEYCYNAIKEGFNEQENEFNINIGNEHIYKGMARKLNRDANMYGTSTLKV